jgi:hypothetical protein
VKLTGHLQLVPRSRKCGSIHPLPHTPESRDSTVGTETGYGLDDRGVGVRVLVEGKNFLPSTSPRPSLGPTEPPIKWVLWVLYPGVNRQRREADHSSPTSAEIKKMWICTFTLECLINYAQGLYLFTFVNQMVKTSSHMPTPETQRAVKTCSITLEQNCTLHLRSIQRWL